jgi:ribosomal protein S8
MMINDPLSDMIARIKNAATRKRSKVLTPASRLRQRVLDVLQDEGYIRDRSRVQAGPPRLFGDRRSEARQERPRHLDPLDFEGRHVRRLRPRR